MFPIRRFSRNFASNGSYNSLKVTICGAAGRAGQAVALMLKTCPLIDCLALYDTKGTNGIAMELNHVDTMCKTCSYKGQLKEALKDSQIVVIVANGPKPANFNANAIVVFDLVTACALNCPKALLTIATNPVNSFVPLASEVFKRHRCYNPNHIFGVTTLNVIRANTIVAQCQGLPPDKVQVPVIGGNTKGTIVPLLSSTIPASKFTNDEITSITHSIRNASKVKRKNCCLSGAYAVSRFVTSLVRAMKGENRIVECAYVASKLYPGVRYMALPLELGIDGVRRNLGLPSNMSDYERCLIHNAMTELNDDIEAGEKFVGVNYDEIERKIKMVCKRKLCP